jgi:hypothetical protein
MYKCGYCYQYLSWGANCFCSSGTCCSLHNCSLEDVHVHTVHHNTRTTEFVHLENNWPLILGKQWYPIHLCPCVEICSAKRHKGTVCCMLAIHQNKEIWPSSITLFWKKWDNGWYSKHERSSVGLFNYQFLFCYFECLTDINVNINYVIITQIMCHRLSMMKTDIKRSLLQGGWWFWQCEILIAVSIRNYLPLHDRM